MTAKSYLFEECLFFLAAATLLLGSCSPALSPAERAEVLSIKLIDSSQGLAPYELLGTVRGAACRPDGAATDAGARTDLRIQAHRLSPDAVVDVLCREQGATIRCWVCTGEAIRFHKPP